MSCTLQHIFKGWENGRKMLSWRMHLNRNLLCIISPILSTATGALRITPSWCHSTKLPFQTQSAAPALFETASFVAQNRISPIFRWHQCYPQCKLMAARVIDSKAKAVVVWQDESRARESRVKLPACREPISPECPIGLISAFVWCPFSLGNRQVMPWK